MSKAYGQSQPYIPSTDWAFRDWLATFSTLISEDPGRFGLDESDATVIANHNSGYASIYQTVQSPSTRTSNSIAQKDAIKASAIASCRVYAMQIKANGGVDNDSKIALGLHVNDTTPTPIPAPSSAPLLNITTAFSGAHVLRFADELTPDSKRKPEGVTQLELYVYVGPQPTIDYEDATYVGVYTKNPIQYEFAPESAGQTATYFARWRTARGLAGPWSLPVGMMIAFGGPVDQQQAAPVGGGTPMQQEGGDEELKIAA